MILHRLRMADVRLIREEHPDPSTLLPAILSAGRQGELVRVTRNDGTPLVRSGYEPRRGRNWGVLR